MSERNIRSGILVMYLQVGQTRRLCIYESDTYNNESKIAEYEAIENIKAVIDI